MYPERMIEGNWMMNVVEPFTTHNGSIVVEC